MAKPTYENTVAPLSNAEYLWIAEYTPSTIAMVSHTIMATETRMNVGRAARAMRSLTRSPELIE